MGLGSGLDHIALSNLGIGMRSYLEEKLKGSIWLTGEIDYNYMQAFQHWSQVDHLDVWQQGALDRIEQENTGSPVTRPEPCRSCTMPCTASTSRPLNPSCSVPASVSKRSSHATTESLFSCLPFSSWAFCHSIGHSAQDNAFSQMVNPPIQSPQAAALNKFVEFPVSYFNGIPNISLPLYDVRSGDIDLPITLSYHAGGIRVNEEASWVGLGWALNAGGLISHDVKGIDDDCGNQHFFNKYFPTNMGNTYYEDNMDAEVIGGTNLLDINGNLVNQTTLFGDLGQGNSVADGEPDLYLYNFGNYSGKFTWINGQVVDLTHNNIQFTKGAGNITAITPDGYSYQFDTTEKTFTGSCPTTVAYYLTQITSPKGKTLSLQYKSFKQLYDANAAAWSTAYDSISLAFTNGDYVAQMPTLFESFANMQFLGGYTQTIQPVYIPRVWFHLHTLYPNTIPGQNCI